MQKGVITLSDPLYPAWLKEIFDPPERLYFWGNLEKAQVPCVGVVGTRNSTPYGEGLAFDWSKQLSQNGLCVVSGLAFGIDAAAHKGALEGPGGTIAVIAQGLEELQPKRHLSLARRIVEAGGLILTEKDGTQEFVKTDYLVRNRIISGLSRGVLVVEAPHKSGALNTAKHANEQGRDVMAVPGRIHDENSQGTLKLMRDGACMVQSAKEVAEALKLPFGQRSAGNLQGFAKGLYELIRKEPRSSPELSELHSGTLKELYGGLANLELNGFIVRLRDGRYSAL